MADTRPPLVDVGYWLSREEHDDPNTLVRHAARAGHVGSRLAATSDHHVPFGLRARPAAGRSAPPRAEPLAASRLRPELHVQPPVDHRQALRAPATLATPLAR